VRKTQAQPAISTRKSAIRKPCNARAGVEAR